MIHRFGGFDGFHSHLWFMPERGIGIAILVNEGRVGPVLATTAAAAIYNQLLDKLDLAARQTQLFDNIAARAEALRERIRQDRERRAGRDQSLPHPLDAYAGTYDNELLGRMVWTVEDGKLHAAFGLAQSDAEVFDRDANQLRVELLGGGSVITFLFDGGRAASLTLANYTFERADR